MTKVGGLNFEPLGLGSRVANIVRITCNGACRFREQVFGPLNLIPIDPKPKTQSLDPKPYTQSLDIKPQTQSLDPKP